MINQKPNYHHQKTKKATDLTGKETTKNCNFTDEIRKSNHKKKQTIMIR
jgi:hypothetical protein